MRVLLIPGYLAPRVVFLPFETRLRRLGHQATTFTYTSHRGSLDQHAHALAEELAVLSASVSEMAAVAHSLGGLLLHRALTLRPGIRLHKRVYIATPHRGAALAQRGRKSPLARWMSGAVKMAAEGYPPADHDSPAGNIVGGRDRVVRPAEAEWGDETARLSLPFGHNELLIRPQTAAAVHRFLCHGSFEVPFTLRDALR